MKWCKGASPSRSTFPPSRNSPVHVRHKGAFGRPFHAGTIIDSMGTMQELGTMGAVERGARIDLAAAFRLAARMDLHEGVCNHFSLMLPDGKRFLLNGYGLHWSEVTASNLLALDSLYYRERACRLQVLARSMGAKLRAVRAEVVRETCRMILADTPKYAGAHFGALKRILDREEPGYSR